MEKEYKYINQYKTKDGTIKTYELKTTRVIKKPQITQVSLVNMVRKINSQENRAKLQNILEQMIKEENQCSSDKSYKDYCNDDTTLIIEQSHDVIGYQK